MEEEGLSDALSVAWHSGSAGAPAWRRVPSAASPCPHGALGALPSPAGAPRSSSEQSLAVERQQQQWGEYPCPGVPCTHSDLRHSPALAGTWLVDPERAFLCLLLCFNKRRGCSLAVGRLKAQPVHWLGAHQLGFPVVIPTAVLPSRVLLVLLQARAVHRDTQQGGTCPKGHGRALLNPSSRDAPFARAMP